MIFIYVSELQEEAPMDKEAPEERKERIYRKPHIDLHDILQKKSGGEKSSEEVTLNVKGKRNIRSMKTGDT
jgi:hypothetical protein